jgi:hypothetical protein
MRRREFLGAGVALPFTPLSLQPTTDDWLIDPESLAEDQLREIVDAVPTEEAEREQLARQASADIADWYTTPIEALGVPRTYLTDFQELGGTSFTWVGRVRKFYDVWEGAFGYTLPNLPVYRAYWGAMHLTNVGNVLLAMRNLAEVSLEITTTVEEASAQAVTDAQYRRFYFAAALVAAESVLSFYVPVDYRLAWRGTRYVTNRILVRFRSQLGLRLYAFVMSEIHFLIRGVRASQMNDPEKFNALFKFVASRSSTLADEFSAFEPPARGELLAALVEIVNALSGDDVQLDASDVASWV